MVEGRVYLCTWTKTGGRFRLWVKNRPTIVAEGSSFEEANERLWGEICGAVGDGEAVTEFDPPPPLDPRTSWYRRAAVVCVSGDARADVTTFEPHFTGGLCSECEMPRGPRNETPLIVDRIDAGGDGAFASVPLHLRGSSSPQVALFSEAFLDVLSSEEMARLTWQRVERRQARARKTFYELVRSEVHIADVGVRGVPCKFGGWRCRTCGYAYIGMYYFPSTNTSPHRWISVADLPRPLPTCFTIGKDPRPHLCFTRARWEELVGRVGTRGLRSSEVGVVDPDRVESVRDLPFLDEQAADA